MPTQLARFTDRCVDLSQKAIVGEPDLPVQKGGGYADWVIVALHCRREYLDHPYRRLLDVLPEMPGTVPKLDSQWMKFRITRLFALECRTSKCGSGVCYLG